MTPIGAVVFDMDGVLIDSEPFWEASEIEAFAKVGLTLTPEMCWQTTGLRINEVVDYWYERQPWEGHDKHAIERAVIDGVIDRVNSLGVALPGVRESIEFFTSKEVPLALASSSYLELIEATLHRLDLREAFTVVHSAEHEAFGKPDPGVYLTTAKLLGQNPQDCVAIEDSVNGLTSAKRAGYRCLVVPDARVFTPEKYSTADVLLKSLTEINESVWQRLQEL